LCYRGKKYLHVLYFFQDFALGFSDRDCDSQFLVDLVDQKLADLLILNPAQSKQFFWVTWQRCVTFARNNTLRVFVCLHGTINMASALRTSIDKARKSLAPLGITVIP
jgi:hypothetical protein